MIDVTLGGIPLVNVKHVQPGTSLARDAFINAAGAGAPAQTVEIRGFILGTPNSLLAQKTAMETSLVALGECDLVVESLGTIPGRVEAVRWEAYTTGPLWVYTISFGPRSKGNPFSGAVAVGALTLNNPTPYVTEEFRTVSDDDKMDTVHSRVFRLQGRFMGTPAGIETFLGSLRDAVTTPATGYFTLTTPMGTFQARAKDLQIQRPEQIDTQRPVTYSVTLETRADYTLESFNLPHQQVNVGGIIWDAVGSFNHSVTRVRKGTSNIYVLKDESINWSLKKYFDSVQNADAFKPSIDELVKQRNTMTSPTGVILECRSVSYSQVARDGYDVVGGRRYALTVSVAFSKPTGGRENPGGLALGISWYEIESDSRGITVDESGGLRSRTRNVSGRVSGLPADSFLGSAILEGDHTYYITGVNFGKIDDDGLWAMSVSARTLDSADECAGFIDEIFSGVHFNDLTSKSRSVSMSQIGDTSKYEATSLSESASGYVWGGDWNALLNLVNLQATFYGAPKITNVSIGKKEAWSLPGTKECTYRQSVSVQRTTNYAPTPPPAPEDVPDPAEKKFDKNQPDVKEEITTEFRRQTDRYSVITIPGGDIVYKKVGVNPAGARIRVQRTARNFHVFNSMAAPPAPGTPGNVPDSIEESDVSGEQGLSKYREKSWIAGSVS